MTFSIPSHSEIREILTDTKTIAVVGASAHLNRPSHGVMAKLLASGYRVIPVNPHESEVLGQKSYASLEDIPEKVDLVNVFRRPEYTPDIAASAVKIGAKVLWLQLGVQNEEAAKRAQMGGLSVVMDLCIAVEHSLLKIPVKRP